MMVFSLCGGWVLEKKMGHRGWNRSGILECVNLDDVSGCLHIDNAVSHLKSTILEILGCSDVEKK